MENTWHKWKMDLGISKGFMNMVFFKPEILDWEIRSSIFINTLQFWFCIFFNTLWFVTLLDQLGNGLLMNTGAMSWYTGCQTRKALCTAMAGTSAVANIGAQVKFYKQFKFCLIYNAEKWNYFVQILLENPATLASANGNDFRPVQQSSGMKQSSMLFLWLWKSCLGSCKNVQQLHKK